MNKIKSVASFIRRALKVKGYTAHNGRGMYEMGFEGVDEIQLKEKLNVLVEKWNANELLERVTEEDGWLEIVFKEDEVDNTNYRTFILKGLRGGVTFR